MLMALSFFARPSWRFVFPCWASGWFGYYGVQFSFISRELSNICVDPGFKENLDSHFEEDLALGGAWFGKSHGNARGNKYCVDVNITWAPTEKRAREVPFDLVFPPGNSRDLEQGKYLFGMISFLRIRCAGTTRS